MVPGAYVGQVGIHQTAPPPPRAEDVPRYELLPPEPPREEKVHAGPSGIVLPWFLPYQPDNLTDETGVMRRAYRQMLADPNIKAAILTKVFQVASLNLQVKPATDEPNKPKAKPPAPGAAPHAEPAAPDPDYDAKAAQYQKDRQAADLVDYCLSRRVDGRLRRTVESICLPALLFGYSVTEKVWATEQRGEWKGCWVPAALKSKAVDEDLVPQTDEFRNVVNLLGVRYNGGQLFDPNDFLIAQHLPLFENPTGMSDLRAVYSRYWMLDTVLKIRAMGLEKRALPMLLGHYTSQQHKSSLEAALAQAKSSNWIAVPEGAKVEALNLAGMADEAFAAAIKDLKHDIFLGILFAVLQSIEGNTTDGRGNSKVHQEISNLPGWYLARLVEDTLQGQLVPEIVDYNIDGANYPVLALALEIDEADLANAIKTDTGLQAIGVKLSKADAYERYGRTPPSDPEDELQPATPPGGAPGGKPGQPPSPPKPPQPGPAKEAEDASDQGDVAVDHASVAADHAAAAIQHAHAAIGHAHDAVPPEQRVKEYEEHAAKSAGDVALAGKDGMEAERLLRASLAHGQHVLEKVTRSALARHLKHAGEAAAQKGVSFSEGCWEAFCGGKGSGRPGPCPKGKDKQHIVARAHAAAAAYKLWKASQAHSNRGTAATAKALAAAHEEHATKQAAAQAAEGQPVGKPAAATAPAAGKAAAVNQPLVAEKVAAMNALLSASYGRELSYDDIAGRVQGLGAGLNVDEAKEVARGVGIPNVYLGSKKKALEELTAMAHGRKESFERVQSIGANPAFDRPPAATAVAPPPAAPAALDDHLHQAAAAAEPFAPGRARAVAAAQTTGEKLHALAGVDSDVFDPLQNAAGRAAGIDHNEYLRSLETAHRDYQQGLQTPADRERLGRDLQSIQARTVRAAAGLRTLGLPREAAWYEQHAVPLFGAVAKDAGVTSARVPAAKPEPSPLAQQHADQLRAIGDKYIAAAKAAPPVEAKVGPPTQFANLEAHAAELAPLLAEIQGHGAGHVKAVASALGYVSHKTGAQALQKIHEATTRRIGMFNRAQM